MVLPQRLRSHREATVARTLVVNWVLAAPPVGGDIVDMGSCLGVRRVMITGTKEKKSYVRLQVSSYTNELVIHRSRSDNHEGK